MFRSVIFAIAIAALATSASFAQNATFRSQKGYTLQMPSRWVAITKQSQAEMTRRVPAQFQQGLKSIDLSEVDVMILNLEDAAYVENVNVVDTGSATPIDEITSEQFVELMIANYKKNGLNIEHAKAAKGKVDNCDAIALTYEVMQGGQRMQQRQYFISTASNTFIITCTSQAKTFATFSRTFDSMVMSFKQAK